MALPRALFAFAGVALGALNAHCASPPVTVSLRSSFPISDPLLEAFETVAAEDPFSIFPILSEFSLTVRPSTPRQAHDVVFAVAANHIPLASLNSARVRLSLHGVTPRLVASAEHYDRHVANLIDKQKLGSLECASWVDWYGQIICDAETLLQVVNSKGDGVTEPHRFPFDHVCRASPSLQESQYTAIHFADPTAPSFHSLHDALLSLEPEVEYVLRWSHRAFQSEQSQPSNYLSGYGVSLDLKKMDYLVLDDRNQHQGHATIQNSTGSIANNDRFSDEDTLSCIFDSLPYVDLAAETRATKGEPLTPDEIADLGLKAIQFIITFSDTPHAEPPYTHHCWENHRKAPLSDVQLFQTLTNSFPLYVTSLARKVLVSGELRGVVYDNWEKAAPGVNMAWANGRLLNENEGSTGGIFGLLRTLQRERSLVGSLVDLGLTTEQAIELLLHPIHSTSQQSNPPSKMPSMRGSTKEFTVANGHINGAGMLEERKSFSLSPKVAEYLEGLVDASDRQENESVVLYWNDLAVDARYAQSSQSLQALLRVHAMSLFSPMCRIRQNLINVIFILDLSQMRSLSLLSSLSDHFVPRGFPVRWGLVPEGDNDSLKMARLVYYFKHKYGRDQMIAFVQGISRAHAERKLSSLSWRIVEETFRLHGADDEFAAVARGNTPLLDETTGGDIITRSQSYLRRLGLRVQGTSGRGHAFVNGRYFPISDNIFQQMAGEITAHLQILQEMVYTGELTDDDIPLMPTFFYDLPSTHARRNPYISVDGSSGRGQASAVKNLRIFNLPEVFSKAGFIANGDSFITPSQMDDITVTIYLIADFDSHEGIELAKETLKYMMHSLRARVTFVHNSQANTTGPISTLISSLLRTGSLREISPVQLLEVFTDNANGQYAPTSQESFISSNVEATPEEITQLLHSHRLIIRQLELEPGQRAVLVNGRLVGPFDMDYEFVVEDFEMLEGFELKQRIARVADAINEIVGEDAVTKFERADLISMASSIIYADQQPDPSEVGLFDSAPKPRTRNYQLLSSNYIKSVIGAPSAAQTHLVVLVDPLSETAQRWSAILTRASELFPDIYIELYFNTMQYNEIPLKRFYRYSIAPGPDYDANGQVTPAQVTFHGLPLEPIYTLSMDVPPSWLVRPREALYDLDNIQLGKLAPEDQALGVQALFTLDYLVVEGHARELKTVNPPRGVQLQLISTKDGSIIDDTQVVANLGYLQFKARPGTFQLEIREGRGKDVYELESVGSEGWDSPSVTDSDAELTVMSFDGMTLYPRLTRKPGSERLDILDVLYTERKEASENIVESWASKISSLVKPKTVDKKIEVHELRNGQADINIFTVASGLLYERFASIMILSVLRNTKSSVKFWFIENFLSPTFLEFIPHMAQEYGFQYELVTYKWPSWLRAQKEKQRIIWAYKILFLDVLFPMDLKKVIFVDADQIVRADLQELVDLDLHGAPYGYTPMGDDNGEMEGFRFWKTGYWHDFLDGKPYHISALYVVDLVRFRQMAAGDLLRGSYQMLSQDPNSLANLDQDLPNNLQAQVPIYSLHEDWLWCETWCSKDRFHRAKTIDLCQNPLTKEPKLSRARQIPEWEEYDNEIAAFARRLAAEGKIHASAATADSNVLAGTNVQSQTGDPEPLKSESHSHDEL